MGRAHSPIESSSRGRTGRGCHVRERQEAPCHRRRIQSPNQRGGGSRGDEPIPRAQAAAPDHGRRQETHGGDRPPAEGARPTPPEDLPLLRALAREGAGSTGSEVARFSTPGDFARAEYVASLYACKAFLHFRIFIFFFLEVNLRSPEGDLSLL